MHKCKRVASRVLTVTMVMVTVASVVGGGRDGSSGRLGNGTTASVGGEGGSGTAEGSGSGVGSGLSGSGSGALMSRPGEGELAGIGPSGTDDAGGGDGGKGGVRIISGL